MLLNVRRRSIAAVILPMFFHAFAADANAAAACTVQATVDRTYKLCVPSAYDASTPAPLVVMLHGCGQTAASFSVESEMDVYAEERGFLVVYPEQPPSANSSRCWNWFLPEHQARGRGEPASIVGVVHAVQSAYAVDDDRIYAAGLSAGGAEAVILGATYPDLFAAIGVSAGLEYKAGTDLVSGVQAMQLGGPDPERQGEAAYAAMGTRARVVPTLVFHGSLDQTVRPVNGEQVIAQWAQTNDLADDGIDNGSVDDRPELIERGVSAGGLGFTHSVYRNTDGATVLEHYFVDGQTHSWSGGAAGGQYTEPRGPEASAIMLDFFFSLAVPRQRQSGACRTKARSTP